MQTISDPCSGLVFFPWALLTHADLRTECSAILSSAHHLRVHDLESRHQYLLLRLSSNALP